MLGSVLSCSVFKVYMDESQCFLQHKWITDFLEDRTKKKSSIIEPLVANYRQLHWELLFFILIESEDIYKGRVHKKCRLENRLERNWAVNFIKGNFNDCVIEFVNFLQDLLQGLIPHEDHYDVITKSNGHGGRKYGKVGWVVFFSKRFIDFVLFVCLEFFVPLENVFHSYGDDQGLQFLTYARYLGSLCSGGSLALII